MYKKEKRSQESTEEQEKGQRRQRRLPKEKKGVQKQCAKKGGNYKKIQKMR